MGCSCLDRDGIGLLGTHGEVALRHREGTLHIGSRYHFCRSYIFENSRRGTPRPLHPRAFFLFGTNPGIVG